MILGPGRKRRTARGILLYVLSSLTSLTVVRICLRAEADSSIDTYIKDKAFGIG